MTRLHGKVCIVTGAGRGIGLAIARKFLQEGASVLLCDLDGARVRAATEELRPLGAVQGLTGDVSRAAFAEELVQCALDTHADLHVLVNNAGIAPYSPFLELPEDVWDQTLSVNLKSMFLLGQRAARAMIARGHGGAIVNMASTNGLMGERDLVAYNASKGGVVLLTKTMAVELAQHDIRVNAVAPGLIATTLAQDSGADAGMLADYLTKIPLRRKGTPAEVANLFAFLASDEASFITGETVVIDGGQLAEQ